MKNSKKIFIAVAIIFFVLILYVAYDISSRTTFPGSRNTAPGDTVTIKEKMP